MPPTRIIITIVSLTLFACHAKAGPLSIQMLPSAGQQPTPAPVVTGPTNLGFSLPAQGHSLSILGRLGPKTNASWNLNLYNSTGLVAKVWLISKGGAGPILEYNEITGYSVDSNALLLTYSPDTYMSRTLVLPGPRKKDNTSMYFLKPNLSHYSTNNGERAAVSDSYPQFPSALTHAFTLRMENTETGVGLWLDSRYLGLVPASANMTTGTVILVASNELLAAYDWPALRSNTHLPLDLSPYARTGTTCRFISEISSLTTSALNTVSGTPFLYQKAQHEIDVGLSRWLEESQSPSYCDNDTTRSAFNGAPESIILAVPTENFLAAHVLCTVEPSTNKVPVLTLRVTRFGLNYSDSGGRCDEAFADTTVVLPASTNEPLPMNVIQVGTIEADGLAMGSPQQTLPVYKVTLPLKMGLIPELLGTEVADFDKGSQHLDIELTKSIRQIGSRRKPIGAPSSVHVLSMTLERNPVDVEMGSAQTGNVFYAAENPAFTVRLTNTRDANPNAVTVTWEVTDYYGRTTVNSNVVVVPGKTVNGGVTNCTIPLSQPILGYFDILLTVKEDLTGRELWRQPSSFVLLPTDTRTAPATNSPFSVWWFNGTHGTCTNLAVMGNLMSRMGMRKICPYNYYGTFTESQLEPYKLSYSMLPWIVTGANEAAKQAALNTFIGKNPNIQIGMIYHETTIPAPDSPAESVPYAEILGQPKPTLIGNDYTKLTNLMAQGMARGEFYRTNYPNIKISVGNTYSGFIAQLLRYGFPTNLVDCFSMEGVAGYTTTESPPQRGAMQEVWWVKEMQRLYGCPTIPLSSGFEYIMRPTWNGSGLTEAEQAEMYIRDAMHCLAYGYLSINIGISEDYNDSYNGTIYGGGGFLRRYPLLTPKPSFAMWATMTTLLDGAQFVKHLDTTSHSLYAMEFHRTTDYVYPFWTVRGKRLLSANVGSTTVTLTDGMGNSTNLVPSGGLVTFQASQAPVYITTTSRITNSIIPSTTSFEEQAIAEASSLRPLIVISPYGTPSPDNTSTQDWYNTVTATLQNASTLLDASNRMQCTGWTLTTGTPAAGTGTQAVFQLDGATLYDPTTLTWQWTNEFMLTPLVSGEGTVDVAAGWFTTGTVVTLTAAPTNPGTFFTGWTGNTHGAAYPSATTIQFTMDEPKTITAVFTTGAPGFTPAGTALAWMDHYRQTNYLADETNDVDQDGFTTMQEFMAGTDPTNDRSFFKIITHGYSEGSNYIVFLGSGNFGSPAYPFGMYFRSNLMEGTWHMVDSNITRSSTGTNTWWDSRPPNGMPFYYRPVATN